MKKIGLCVRYDCNNYGSMLQIKATQRIIEELGSEYELIRYDKITPMFLLKNLTRVFNPYFMWGKVMDFSKQQKLNRHPEQKQANAKRLALFAEYRKKHIGPYSEVYKGYDALVAGSEKYDAVMVGSDQLWTPAGIKSKFYNLLFVPDHIKKISFATSFGVSQIPAQQRAMTQKYLQRIDHISVRELNGAKIVQELTGREATVVMDPTLLFDGDKWRSIFPEKRIVEEKYIFAYFLGSNPEHREAVNQLKAATGLPVVTCPNMDEFVEGDLSFGEKPLYEIDPVDFLNLIRGAEYICTDSFHGSVFSILNHKQFVTFDRYAQTKQSRNSRIDSLFAVLGLEARRFDRSGQDFIAQMNAAIDYESVDTRLAEQRNISFDFLEKAVK